eukprot:2903300-Alexandrium_andersonii.AAC.1
MIPFVVAALLGIFGCDGNVPPAQAATAQASASWPMDRAVHMVNGNPATLARWLRPARQEQEQLQQRDMAVRRAVAELARAGEVRAYEVSDDEAGDLQPVAAQSASAGAAATSPTAPTPRRLHHAPRREAGLATSRVPSSRRRFLPRRRLR